MRENIYLLALSAAKFLQEHVIEPCPYSIDVVYSGNGTEYRGTDKHELSQWHQPKTYLNYDGNVV